MKLFLISLIIIAFSVKTKAQSYSESKVSTDSLLKYVLYLSSDQMEGRLPGTEGYELASAYVIHNFSRWGIQWFSSIGSYKQIVPLENNIISGPCIFQIQHYQKGNIDLQLGKQYNFRGFTGSGDMTIETVFCGYGLHNNEYSDYKNIDVKGKAVLIFKGNPDFSNGKTYEPFSIRNRAQIAKDQGASAVIFIPIPGTERPGPIGSVMCGEGNYIPDMPLIQIDPQTTEFLFDGCQISLQEAYLNLKTSGVPQSTNLLSKIYVHVQTRYLESIEAFNIIGYIEGADPLLKSEYIFLTAHLDHVGSQCDVIYPGANDNASGSAAVMEMARLFSKIRQKRSIVFCLLTAEEQGLFGAKYLASHLPVDTNKIIAVFNFDCIAVGDSIQIGNGLTCPGLFDIVKSQDDRHLVISDTWKGGGADLTPFSELQIPGLYFVSKYSYTHLHLPSDKIETLNPELFSTIVQLGFLTTINISEGKYKREKPIQ